MHPGLRKSADALTATCLRVLGYRGGLAVAVAVKFFGGTSIKRNDWLAARKAPKLRGRVAGR